MTEELMWKYKFLYSFAETKAQAALPFGYNKPEERKANPTHQRLWRSN